MYQFSSSTLCQLHAHTYAIQNVLAKTVFREIHNFNHDNIRRVTELFSLYQVVGAAVSEIRKSNQNKEKEKNFENWPFLGI